MGALMAQTGISTPLVVISILTLPIKGYALWQSARISKKWWFIVLFITNTLGILDLYYILVIARKYRVETREVVE